MTTTLKTLKSPVVTSSLPVVQAFQNRNGEAHLLFACHAALPLGLTPELLYSLWANFQTDCQGKSLDIPWVATADLLLSNLCEEVGAGIYEMLPEVRAALVDSLEHDSRFEMKRIRAIAAFLTTYVHPQLNSENLDIRDFAQAQNWLSTAYLRPEKAVKELSATLANAFQQKSDDLLRVASIVSALEKPLADYPDLLAYAHGMANYAMGDIEAAQKTFDQLRTSAQSYDFSSKGIPLPSSTRQKTKVEQKQAPRKLPVGVQVMVSLAMGILASGGVWGIRSQMPTDRLLAEAFLPTTVYTRNIDSDKFSPVTPVVPTVSTAQKTSPNIGSDELVEPDILSVSKPEPITTEKPWQPNEFSDALALGYPEDASVSMSRERVVVSPSNTTSEALPIGDDKTQDTMTEAPDRSSDISTLGLDELGRSDPSEPSAATSDLENSERSSNSIEPCLTPVCALYNAVAASRAIEKNTPDLRVGNTDGDGITADIQQLTNQSETVQSFFSRTGSYPIEIYDNYDVETERAVTVDQSIDSVEDRLILERADRLADRGSVDFLQAAIQEARKVGAGRTLSREADERITNWIGRVETAEDRPILERADRLAAQGTSDSLRAAIQEARKVGAGRTLGQIADERILIWTKRIQIIEDQPVLDAARARARTGDLSEAIAIANRIGEGRALHDQGQADVAEWQFQLMGQSLLNEAIAAASSGDPEALVNAIGLAQSIRESSGSRSRADQQITQWSWLILRQAEAAAQRGIAQANVAQRDAAQRSLETAISLASKIPSGTEAYSPAQVNIQNWQASFRKLENSRRLEPVLTPAPRTDGRDPDAPQRPSEVSENGLPENLDFAPAHDR